MIDLHIHTIATPHHSSWEPEALAAAAARAGLRVIAATDHNSLAMVQAVQQAGARHGIHVVSGVEIDSGFPAGRADDLLPYKLWHMLVYNADAGDPRMRELCDAVFQRNQADAAALRATLVASGFRLDGLDQLGRPPNVAEVAAALARGNELPGRVAGDDDEVAGMRYVLTCLPGAYRPVGVAEVIAVAHACGGLAVLAHPGRAKGIYAIPATDEDLLAMAAVGLDGIEVYYPTHQPEQVSRYRAFAERQRLLMTGGSDSHHPAQPLAAWDAELCRAFLERIGVL